ncbi:translation initiation factor 1 [Desulfosalsimonas propionicica]|uniref:Translation initiation factor 1 n=1 Tax=Desulfosalsimonas propionicica TaxID=332175 RepID=A0A7W0HJ47_9BACT|nr:translation initiation factor Sui1 [Desulfosalsimonas propionicica]MBA2879696.1 translation initiation factor 1 [Desulfosalsimonas propionicica]
MTHSSDNNSRLVYSTEKGRICQKCGKPQDACQCRKKTAASPGDGIVRIKRETKGRKGKGVTLITGTGLDPEALKQLAKQLKARCGSGGTVKNGQIEIQGDHREMLAEELKKEGFAVKRAGG